MKSIKIMLLGILLMLLGIFLFLADGEGYGVLCGLVGIIVGLSGFFSKENDQ